MTNQSQREAELLNCPFCGGNARLWQQSRGHAVVGCEAGSHNCRASPTVSGPEAQAIAAWNRRIPSRGGVEELADRATDEALTRFPNILASIDKRGAGEPVCFECDSELAGPYCPACNPVGPCGPPEGFVLVPTTPSEAMIAAGLDPGPVYGPDGQEADDLNHATAIYRAMISARPPVRGAGEPDNGHDQPSYYRGVRACIAWLHARADTMNDPHAKSVLNSAAFNLGRDKPAPHSARPPVRGEGEP
jgi:hypothetical protein